MSMTSGQSIFGFIGRVLGTAIAMVCSIVIWYIVDQKTPGIIVMLWFFIFLEMYFFIKYMRFIAIFLVCIVTQILVIGYELQVRKIGIAAGGCPYYILLLERISNGLQLLHQANHTTRYMNSRHIGWRVLLVVLSWRSSGPSSPTLSQIAATSAKTSAQLSTFWLTTIVSCTQPSAPECTIQRVISV